MGDSDQMLVDPVAGSAVGEYVSLTAHYSRPQQCTARRGPLGVEVELQGVTRQQGVGSF